MAAELPRQSSSSSSNYLGLALIIANNYAKTKGFHPLPGTHTDAKALRLSLESLHFKCSVRTNTTARDFAKELDGFVSSNVPSCCKYVLFAFCGHGDEQAVFSQDGKRLETDELVKKFHAEQMPHLAGKVRLLFIDACRGDEKDYGVVVTVQSRGGMIPPQIVLPRGANILVAFSTLPGYISQEVKDGYLSKSVWTPILAEELAKRNDNILEVLVAVNLRMLEYSTELGKKNPKIFAQSQQVVNSLMTTVNLVKEAKLFQQWLMATEDSRSAGPPLVSSRTCTVPAATHRYNLRSRDRGAREVDAKIVSKMKNLHM